MKLLRLIGRCAPLFFVAVTYDVIGVVLLFVGIFANLRIDGRFYGDFFIYTGSLMVFLSLFCWIVWYAGNIPVSEDEGVRKRSSIARLARKFSERLGQTLRGEQRAKRVEVDGGSQAGAAPPHKASRVTWGKATAYYNNGSADPPSEERSGEGAGTGEQRDTPGVDLEP